MVNRGNGKVWIPLLLTMVLSLAACMPIMPEAAPASAVTPASTEEAAEEATAAPTEEAMEEPTFEPTEEATAEAASEDLDVGSLVRQILAEQLQLDVDQIKVVTVEEVEWPDACLGVYTADIMCAQVITPGYRVVLDVDGQQYEYHTNSDGSFVQLFSAPEANIGEVLITWEQTLDTCQSAQIGSEGVVFGPCLGVQMGGKLVSPEREGELADLVTTFAPFEAETPAGIVTIQGPGNIIATPAEQRMIAEWARLVAQEASADRSGASWGLAFAWHREGGFAGFCDDLTAYVTGQLTTSTCKGQSLENLAQRRMTAEELERLYAWLDAYAPFEYISDNAPVADSMRITLVFSGIGSTAADEATQESIVAFAQELYASVS